VTCDLRLNTSHDKPEKIRGCARMVFINLAFVLDELTDARWPVDFVVAKCGQGYSR